MKATQFREYGGPDVLELVETGEPHADPGEIRVAVRAAGINAMDWKIRGGYMREMMPVPLPAGSGMDAAGLLDEIGEGAVGVALGDAVFGTGTSTYAEYAVLADWARMPEGWTFILSEAPAAHEASQAGHVAGRTVIVID